MTVCPNCGGNDLTEGVTTETFETFDYGCGGCGAVFDSEDAQ